MILCIAFKPQDQICSTYKILLWRLRKRFLLQNLFFKYHEMLRSISRWCCTSFYLLVSLVIHKYNFFSWYYASSKSSPYESNLGTIQTIVSYNPRDLVKCAKQKRTKIFVVNLRKFILTSNVSEVCTQIWIGFLPIRKLVSVYE